MHQKIKYLGVLLLFGWTIQPTTAAETTFSDVLPDNPNYPAIEYLHRAGVFNGYDNGTFQLEKEMNRAELMTIVTRGQGLELDSNVYNNCFPDVTNQWFAAPVCYAKEQGWVQGYDTGLFDPSRAVSEAEALKIILRPYFGAQIDTQTHEEIWSFREPVSKVDDWQAPYIGFADNHHLLQYHYEAAAPRAEIAEIFFRAKLMNDYKWDKFYPFLRDNLLFDLNIEDTLTDLPRCYSAPDNKDVPFIRNYMESRYGALAPEDTGMPYLDDGHVCLESNGNILYSVGAVFEKDAMHQIVRFDRNGNVLAEDSIACDPVGFNFQWLTNFQDGDENYSLGYGEHKNFKFIACNYIKADDKIYFGNHQIEGVDISTFDVFSETYSFDKNHIYNQNLIDEHFYDKNYQALNEHYIKGDRLVYYYLDELYELKAIVLDTDTFEVLEGNYARDAKSVYYGANRLNPQPDLETFEVLEDDLARDKDHVYYGSFTVEGVDMASFEYLEEGRYKDAEREYKYGHPIEENNNAIDTNDNSNIIYYNYY